MMILIDKSGDIFESYRENVWYSHENSNLIKTTRHVNIIKSITIVECSINNRDFDGIFIHF